MCVRVFNLLKINLYLYRNNRNIEKRPKVGCTWNDNSTENTHYFSLLSVFSVSSSMDMYYLYNHMTTTYETSEASKIFLYMLSHLIFTSTLWGRSVINIKVIDERKWRRRTGIQLRHQDVTCSEVTWCIQHWTGSQWQEQVKGRQISSALMKGEWFSA